MNELYSIVRKLATFLSLRERGLPASWGSERLARNVNTDATKANFSARLTGILP